MSTNKKKLGIHPPATKSSSASSSSSSTRNHKEEDDEAEDIVDEADMPVDRTTNGDVDGDDSEHGDEEDEDEESLDLMVEGEKSQQNGNHSKNSSVAKKPSNKRKRSSVGNDSEEEDDNDVDEKANGEIDVDFEFFDPLAEDYHAVKTLLSKYVHVAPSADSLQLPDESQNTKEKKPEKRKKIAKISSAASFSVNEFADLICNQQVVGTMCKTGGVSGAIIGFITLLDWNTQQHLNCFQQLRSYILAHCPVNIRQSFQDFFQSAANPASVTAATSSSSSSSSSQSSPRRIGLLVCERLFNFPPQLVGHLQEALLLDLDWAQKNASDSPFSKNSWHFDDFLFLTRCTFPSGKISSQNFSERTDKKKKDKKTINEAAFADVDEELYMKYAKLSCVWKIIDEKTDPSRIDQYQAVVVMPANSLRDVVKALKGIYGTGK